MSSDDGSVFSVDDGSDFDVPVSKPKAKAAIGRPAVKKVVQTTLKSKAAPKAAPAKRPKPQSDDEDLDESSGFSNTPPCAKKQKKEAPPKRVNDALLSDVENDSPMADAPPAKQSGNKKTVEEKYKKLTQLEHIKQRPDTYIGSVEKTDQQLWVYNKEMKQMEYRTINYVPGFYKIFDEILVNAADNKQRDNSMNSLKVTIDRSSGEISVENNGKGIPIVIHEVEKVFIPELIFGHLLAGSNFDDNEMKTVGGRNGYGAKLCNVFSTEFTLECQDSSTGKRYKQTWTDNMGKIGKAKITASKSADFVRVTFMPDYKRFGMPEGITDDLEALLFRRVYDLAGTMKGVKVQLNGEVIKVKDFKSYCDLYAKSIAKERSEEEGGTPTCTVEIDKDKGHPRWEIGFTVSDGSFQQVSFVNSIATTTGGTHVNYIADQITASLLKTLDKKKKGHGLKQTHLRNHIFIFVNCLINNPAFNSQTKEQMTTKVSQFGSTCKLSEDFLKKVAKSDAIAKIMEFAERKADKMLAKSDGNKRSRVSNASLVEANLAGSKRGHECTLILTEGESAKGLAVSGRAVLDPDRIGVFPLRGKLLNVRDASIDQISKNQEIQNIKQFLGLKHKQVYTDTKGLRYGHLMIMTDQDHDGSHIKGLLINFLQVQYPSLLKIPDFLREFITPVVKVWQGPDPKRPQKLKGFFTMPEYEEWKEANKNQMSRWHYRYLKGLGSTDNDEAQVYFTRLDEHLKEFDTMKAEEADLLDLAFSKKKADARKEWLGNFIPGTFLDHSSKVISYGDFVNKELILFSMADNMRSIPSMVDGFKPGQRKVLYACFKGNRVKDIKVAELHGYVSQQTAYHHGEASLQQTIIGMAQDFVGSNNINVLVPSGNFGSRLAGGSDAASPRYIFTRLSPFARKVFSALDDPTLKHQYEDGKQIEPEVFAPILPMVLVNGADGIGTGWSTSIPNYHPLELVKALKRRMGRLDDGDSEEKPFEAMNPWFRGWKGTSEAAGPNRYQFNGIAYQNEANTNEFVVTELPIRMWTDDFKAKLEKIISGVDGPSWIKDYKEYNDHKTVHFEIMVDEKHTSKVVEEGILQRFKLTKQIATSNLVAFNTRGQIQKYEKVEDILEEYYNYRFSVYTERKKYWLGVYMAEFLKLQNQARFIQEIIDGELIVGKKKKVILVAELRQRKYDAFPPKSGKAEEEDDDDEEEDSDGGARDFDYLLAMPIWSLTLEKLEKLKEAIKRKRAEHDDLLAKSEKDLWCIDLDSFLEEWEKQLALEAETQTKIRRMGRRASKKIGAGKDRKPKKDDDYEPAVKKPPRAKAKAGVEKAPVAVKTETKTAQRFAEMFGAKTKVKKEAKEDDDYGGGGGGGGGGNMSDDFSDDDFMALSRSKPASKPASKPGKSKAKVKSDSESEEAVPIRSKRAAAAKAQTLFEDDSESDDDDDKLLGDVGALVKGIGKGGGESPTRLSLHAMSRPESSHGTAAKAKAKTAKAFTIDSEDDTNYEMLAKSSPQKTAMKDEADSLLSGDEPAPVVAKKQPAVKAKVKSVAAAAAAAKDKGKDGDGDGDEDIGVAAVKKRGRPAGSKNKASKAEAPAKAAPKAKASKPVAEAVELSPAAERYMAKQKEKKAKKASEEDEGGEEDSSPPRPAARGRARAATRRPVVIDDDSSMQLDESESDPFEIDDDEE